MTAALLIVAGTDPLGGAGLYAHAAVALRRGVLPLWLPSAWVVQSSLGVQSVHPVDPSLLDETLALTLQERTPDAVLLGLMGNADAIDTVARHLRTLHASTAKRAPIVIDPVLQEGGPRARPMVDAPTVDAYRTLLDELGPRAVLTPNAIELGRLLDRPPATELPELIAQARDATNRWGCALLAKGGHLSPPGTDVLCTRDHVAVFPAPLVEVPDVHGTGCRLAAELACELLRGRPLRDAVLAARLALADAFEREVVTVGRGRPQFRGWAGEPERG